MPPPDEVIDNAVDTLSTIKLKSFTAVPGRVRPTNEVTLKWEATKPTGPLANKVGFRVRGLKVANAGTQKFNPVRPASVSLIAEALGVQSILGTVAVDVDLDSCFVNSIPDSELASRFRADMETEFPRDDGKPIRLTGPDVTVRVRDTRLRVETGGMIVGGEFDVEINNAPDGMIEIDARIALGTENGLPRHTIQKFSPNFEFVGNTSILSLGLAELVDLIIDSVAGDTIRKSVDASVGRSLRALAGTIPNGLAMVTLSTGTRRVDVTLCPTVDPG